MSDNYNYENLMKLAFELKEEDLWNTLEENKEFTKNEKITNYQINQQTWKIADWLSNNDRIIGYKSSDDEENSGFFTTMSQQISSSYNKTQKTYPSKYRLQKYSKITSNYGNRNQKQNNQNNNQIKKNQQNQNRYKQMNYNRCQYKWFLKPSIQLKESWQEIESLNFDKISKIRNNQLPQVDDIMWCGSLNGYNINFDHVKRNPILLKAPESTQFSVAASEDPIIRSKFDMANIFTTDIVISTLMTCVKSLASWHIAIVKIDDFIFLDKRHESDLSFVCENARDPPFDFDINSPLELALEATCTRQKYITQSTQSSNCKKMDNPDPFITNENSKPSSVAYRYRLFTLPDNTKMMVRCKHDAFITENNDQYIDIYTLLQWSSNLSPVDWRNKFFDQAGSILASEIKNNNNKIARWTANAFLSNTDQIKIGFFIKFFFINFSFISRNDFRSNKSHCIVGSNTLKPQELATMIDFDYANAWGIVYKILEIIKRLSDGTYILIKNTLQIYKTPDSNLPSEDEDVDIDIDDQFPLLDNFEYDDMIFN